MKQKTIKSLKGTHDILPQEAPVWQKVEALFHELCSCFAYKEIRIPVIEASELFKRGVGDTTDVVNKEMYSFIDRGGRDISLRPEGTAGVVRSFIEHGMSSEPFPVKLYYLITAYRAENVQAGRYREFRQFGAEAFGSEDPAIDVELISMLDLFFRRLGLTNCTLYINSIGDPASRAIYRERLTEYYRPHTERLCPACRARLEKNPLRLLDCKEETCRGLAAAAPKILDFLSEEARKHWEAVLRGLDELGVAYKVNPLIVRGLDYYSKTVFEFVLDDSTAAQAGTICGGGRYDGLVEMLGGNDCPGIGFSIGGERLISALHDLGIAPREERDSVLYIATQTEEAKAAAGVLAYRLRAEGIRCETDLCGRSLKAQLKYANKSGNRYLVVLGERELASGTAQLRDLRRREEADLPVKTEAGALAAQLRALLAKDEA